MRVVEGVLAWVVSSRGLGLRVYGLGRVGVGVLAWLVSSRGWSVVSVKRKVDAAWRYRAVGALEAECRVLGF